jgi:mycothiol synthase
MPRPPVALLTSENLSSAVGAVARLDEAARAADGVPALNEAVWRDLEQPAPDSAGVLVDGVAYAHVARNDNFSPRHWTVGLVVAPGSRDPEVVRSVLDTAVQHIARNGGGRAVCWVLDAQPIDDDRMAASGFAPARDLYEMRVPLPVTEEPRWPDGVVVRDFEPGRDEAAWLEVNNRAFRNHPEQGGWIEETLRRRMREPWFDPSLFLLAFDEQGLAGFDWCKIHEGHGREPALGEIFVIGVDPRRAGTGLGRPLALAGLARMHGRGIGTGMLFCAADNAPALRLYRSLGFTVHRVDRAYEREVPAA